MMKIVRGMMRRWVGVMTASVCLVAVSLFGCGRNERDAEVWDMMMRADGMMDSNPEMALEIMDSIDGSRLEGETLGRYALLMTKAENKNHIFQDNDSLIKVAADYYSGRGDSLEVQALYYRGYQLKEMGEWGQSLIYLTDAYEKALQTKDDFFTAMSARGLGMAYGELMNYKKKLEWSKIAKEYFEKAGKPEHTAWMDVMIISSMIGSGRMNEADSTVNKITESDFYNENRTFRHNILRQKSQIHDYRGEDSLIILTYDIMRSEDASMRPFDWIQIAEAYLRLGDYQKVGELLTNADEGLSEITDSLYYRDVEVRLIALTGDYERAYKEAFKLERDILHDGDRQIMNPQTQLLTDYLGMKYDLEKEKSEKVRLKISVLILAMALLVSIVMIVTLYLLNKIKSNKIEKYNLKLQIEALNKDLRVLYEKDNIRSESESKQNERIATLISEIHTKTAEIELMELNHKNQSIKTIEEVTELYVPFLSTLINIIDKHYFSSVPGKQTISDTRVLEDCISPLKDQKVLDKMIEIIDKYNEGWIGKFFQEYPKHKKEYSQVIIFRYLNFSNESIMLLTGKKKIKDIYNIEYRIRKKFYRIGGDYSKQILNRLGL